MSENNLNQADKVPFGQMVGYSIGGFGWEFLYSTIGIFAMYFLTDVALIGAALAGVILLVSRFWDAFADLFVGYLSDQTKSRWGKRRPYLLFGAIPMGLFFFLFWLTPPLSPELRVVYYMALMVLTWTAYSVVNVPWSAMVPDITRDYQERSKIVGAQRFFSMIGLLIVGALTRPIADSFSSPQAGWANMAMIYGIIMIVFALIPFFAVRERFASEVKKYDFKDVFQLIGKNTPFLILCLVVVCVFFVFTISGIMMNYYFEYCLKNVSLISIAFLVGCGLGMFMIPLWILVSNKIGKKLAYILAIATYGSSYGALYFVYPSDLTLLIPLSVTFAIGFSGAGVGMGALLPDTVEYGEWKTGVRNEGLQYGLYTFILKLATSLAAIIAGVGLQISGYVANVEQTEGSLMGIRVLISIVPFVISVIGVIILLFYPINGKMHAQMLKELEERKKVAGV
jgi:GPH family glycoside/pentoside/hexuronide:cation symporter